MREDGKAGHVADLVPLVYHTPEDAIPGPTFVRLVAEMRASQKRWPMHPAQASIETMAREQKVDEAMEKGIAFSVVRSRCVESQPKPEDGITVAPK